MDLQNSPELGHRSITNECTPFNIIKRATRNPYKTTYTIIFDQNRPCIWFPASVPSIIYSMRKRLEERSEDIRNGQRMRAKMISVPEVSSKHLRFSTAITRACSLVNKNRPTKRRGFQVSLFPLNQINRLGAANINKLGWNNKTTSLGNSLVVDTSLIIARIKVLGGIYTFSCTNHLHIGTDLCTRGEQGSYIH